MDNKTELLAEPDRLQAYTAIHRLAWQASIDLAGEAQKKQQIWQEEKWM